MPGAKETSTCARPATPIHAELVSIVRKIFGLAAPLHETLAPLAEHVVAAFVCGSVAKATDTAISGIDLLLVADALTYADVIAGLHPLVERRGCEIHPMRCTGATWRKRLFAGNTFVTRVLAQPRIWIIGSEHDLDA